MEQSAVDKAWNVFYSLMQNHPLWPSTMTTCKCGRAFGRGAGKCHLCLREELAEHAGPILAERADRALAEVVETWGLIREEVDRRANVEVRGDEQGA